LDEGAHVPLTPRRILATGFGALLVLYVLTAAWIVVNSNTESASADTERFAVADITVALDDESITLTGRAPSEAFAHDLIDSLATRRDITVVINQLEIDESAPRAPIETFHTGIDALRGELE